MDWAAKNGHFDVVRWLYLNRSEGCSTDAMRSKHIAIVRYLFENGLVTDRQELKSALEFAQNFGRHVIAEYLKSVLEQKI